MKRYVCIHGHFYQPPRENPWLETVEWQDSAYPFHDWNDRVTAECYAPNAWSRILDGEGRIVEIVNNYSKISFNFGPTLLAWMELHAPDVYQAILEADRESRRRFGGHGSAIAQAYNHMILPLAHRRDKITQIRWGLCDFEWRFGRRAEGMWLPETAVDLETLDLLAEHGVAYTILAPHQAARVRGLGEREWRDVTGGRIDPSMPYWVELPSGRRIAVFFYDGPISRAVAFERLLMNGEAFARRLIEAFDERRRWPQLVHLATDGETYGHHHRHGEMALAYALDYLERQRMAELTNYGEYLERHPPTHVVEIHERTAWSCAHGLGRWTSDCGCRGGGGGGDWNQAWRAPLRAAFDWLRDELAPRYEEKAGELLVDPWAARDAYIQVVLDRSKENVDAFLRRHGRRELAGPDATAALKLLELERHLMLMYTSCGWFFDELSGIETVQVIQYAGRAIQLAEELFGGRIEEPFLERLERAPSNLPEHGNGRAIYERCVRPARIDLLKVGAHYAVSSVLDQHGARTRLFCYDVERPDFHVFSAGRVKLVVGRIRIVSRLTRETEDLTFAVLHLGEHNVSGGVRRFRGEKEFEDTVRALGQAFNRGDLAETLRRVSESLDETIHSLKALFRDEQRRIVNALLGQTVAEVETAYRGVFDRNAPLMRYLASLGLPAPKPLQVASEMVLSAELRRAARDNPLDVERLESLMAEARTQNVRIDEAGVAYALGQTISDLAEQFRQRPADASLLGRLEEAVGFASTFPREVDLGRAQNVYFALARTVQPEMQRLAFAGDEAARSWLATFRSLGEKLRMRVA